MNPVGLLCGGLTGLGFAIVAFPGWARKVRWLAQEIIVGSRAAAQTRTARMHSTDLAIIGWSATDLVTRQLIGAVSLSIGLGFITASFIGAAYSLVFVLVGAVAGLAVPVIVLRSHAKAKRRSFLHAFSAYLDLVNVLLAGGSGIETALISAADAGEGWTFDTIRIALDRARLTRRSPWSELRAVGLKWGLSEVVEVAGSMSLSGEHGARIRSSLAARADSMRARQIAEVEALAQSATERMGLPMMMLFVGFMVFLGYPALQTVVMSM